MTLSPLSGYGSSVGTYSNSPSFLSRARLAVRLGKSVGKYVKQSWPKSKPRVYPMKNKGGRYTTGNPINAQAGRASMKRKGTKNEKLKSTKKVKVSKSLRAKVEKVISGENAYGAYYVRYGGMVGYIDPGASAVINRVIAVGRDANFVAAQWGGTTFPAGSRVWWQAHCQNGGTGALSNVVTNTDRSMVYFSPLKILDAASVLWNEKAANADWSVVAGNFSLSTGITTGTPQLGSSQFPSTGPLEIRVINSYVTWRMKNTSQRSLLVRIYHCVPKQKYVQVSPLTILQNAGTGILDTATVKNEITAGPVNAGGSIASTLTCHPLFEPNHNASFSNAWKYSQKIINIKPGEECIHSIQGPKNFTLDYSKLVTEGNSEIGSFYKPTTVVAMVSIEIDPVFGSNAGSGGLTNQLYSKTTNANASITCPLAIEIDEVYKLSCPQNTGFISRAAVAGAIQTNNLKTKRQVFVNWNQIANAADTYTQYNEENIGVGIPESIVS